MAQKVNCLNKETNKTRCPCPKKDCLRYGICCECVYYHKNCGNKPACLR